MLTKRYDFMHKNHLAASVTIEPLSGMIDTFHPVEADRLPYGAAMDVIQFRKWWTNRATPITQGDLQRILQEYGIATPQSLLVRCLGLSLNDHYWIRPERSGLLWKNVSLFSNPFDCADKSFGSILSETFSEEHPLILSPSGSMKGEMQKKWVIEDGKRRLLKCDGRTGQQAANEVFAAQIHESQQKVPFVSYELCPIEEERHKQLGCICDCFTNEEFELIPAIDVLAMEKKRSDVSYFQHFIDVCSAHGMSADTTRQFLEYQILTDFVITNTDRHFNNFGVLRNSNTLQFVGTAPIFDSGSSLFWSNPNPKHPAQVDLLDIPVNSFRRRECELLRYVTQPQLVNLSVLPPRSALHQLMQCVDIADDTFILDVYEKKLELLDQIQHGYTLHPHVGVLLAEKKPLSEQLLSAVKQADSRNRSPQEQHRPHRKER